jgi:hypothetical protein
MCNVVFTDDAFVILATIPIASAWPCNENAFASSRASEVLAGKGRRVGRFNQPRGNTTLVTPAERSDVERSE